MTTKEKKRVRFLASIVMRSQVLYPAPQKLHDYDLNELLTQASCVACL